MILRKTPEELDKIAAAGEILVRCHEILKTKARPGVTTLDLDKAAERFIRSQGAEPAFKGYRGFPGSICASPNSMVVHGIPGPYALRRGDLLSIDIGVVLDGWVADAAITHAIGNVTPVANRLLGHGIGRDMHEDPQIPNFGDPGTGPELEEGMVLAIEPMVNAGNHQVRMGSDNWAVYSQDGSLTAHFEFTVAITAEGPRILTPWHLPAEQRAPAGAQAATGG
jgi:methionyl aminopeptidase